jgi:hypothetical protein
MAIDLFSFVGMNAGARHARPADQGVEHAAATGVSEGDMLAGG